MSTSFIKQAVVMLAATTACAISMGGPLAAVAATSDAQAATAASAQPQHRHAGRRGMADPLMLALRQLDLTPEQQSGIHSLISSARQAQRTELRTATGSLFVTLGNPGDPNYATALASAKARAADRIQTRSQLDLQIYALLTAEQQAQLPQVLAAMQAKFQARHGG
jgi:Spy/CpxP family protein refolding chaperone